MSDMQALMARFEGAQKKLSCEFDRSQMKQRQKVAAIKHIGTMCTELVEQQEELRQLEPKIAKKQAELFHLTSSKTFITIPGTRPTQEQILTRIKIGRIQQSRELLRAKPLEIRINVLFSVLDNSVNKPIRIELLEKYPDLRTKEYAALANKIPTICKDIRRTMAMQKANFDKKLYPGNTKATSEEYNRTRLLLEEQPCDSNAIKAHSTAQTAFAEAIENVLFECTICFEAEDFLPDATTPCNHGFHKTCLLRWLCMSKTCPVCRGPVFKEDLV